MPTKNEDNIFDEDDALGYIIYKEIESGASNNKKNGSCLAVLLLFLVPAGSVIFLLKHL